MNVAILSAIYGSYERAARPLPRDLPSDVPAIMMTDDPGLDAPGWLKVVTPSTYPGARGEGLPVTKWRPDIVMPMLAHKYWKCHPRSALDRCRGAGDLSGVDMVIWLDGNMEIKVGGPEFIMSNLTALGDDDWSAIRHPWRDCIYDEAEYTAKVCFDRYDAPAIIDQAENYRRSGFPEHWGLFASGHSVRRLTPTVVELGRDWWVHNLLFTHQDQISLPLMFWKWTQDVMPLDRAPLRWNARLPWATLWHLHGHGS